MNFPPLGSRSREKWRNVKKRKKAIRFLIQEKGIVQEGKNGKMTKKEKGRQISDPGERSSKRRKTWKNAKKIVRILIQEKGIVQEGENGEMPKKIKKVVRFLVQERL